MAEVNGLIVEVKADTTQAISNINDLIEAVNRLKIAYENLAVTW